MLNCAAIVGPVGGFVIDAVWWRWICFLLIHERRANPPRRA